MNCGCFPIAKQKKVHVCLLGERVPFSYLFQIVASFNPAIFEHSLADRLRDTNQAKERYEEVINLVRFGRTKLKIFTDKEYYEGNIDPNSGKDWNQSSPVDTKPTLNDFRKTVSDYLAWELSNILKSDIEGENSLGK